MHIPDSPDVSYWDASPLLQRICRQKLDAACEPRLAAMGERAAKEVAPLAQIADRESPRLVTHDAHGNRINRVDYHPSYREMERIAYGSGMITVNYTNPSAHSRTFGFALGYLFAMAEMGLYCPLCMTDGVARVLTRHGTREQIDRVVPHLIATNREELWTGGMFLTERAGGSDVGANETIERNGRLTGHKWFCSNVDADAVVVTARPEGGAEGTRGLQTYLLLQRDNPGVTIERLKEKLGVRSMPTGEVTLTDAPAELVGSFAPMTDMLNLSRLYNSVASIAVMGRAIHEARWYIERRRAFGKPVIEWPLARDILRELEVQHERAMLLTFATIDAMERADAGDADGARMLRILTPMTKAVTGKLAVPCVSEAMELIGGNGYIEESPMPRLLRDAQVLPIWEGTTSILVLDAIRTAKKERGHELLLAEIEKKFPKEASRLERIDEENPRTWVFDLARLFSESLRSK